MSNRKPYKSGDFSLGLIHEFTGAFGRQGGNPQMLRRLTENPILMRRAVQCISSGGVYYTPTVLEETAMDILGADNVLNPSLTLLAWPKASQVRNPPVNYSADVLAACAEANKPKSKMEDSDARWKLIYVHGFSLREQKHQHSQHFRSWMDSDTKLWKHNDKAEWMTLEFPPGYYLVNYTALEPGGKEYRERQDKLLKELGLAHERVPINVLSEIAISLYYALGEKHAEFSYASHWSGQKAVSGNFVSLKIKLDGRIYERRLELAIDDKLPGKSWAGDAFVGSHGMCVYQKHE